MESGLKLNDGRTIPRLGLGVFRSQPGQETKQAVLWALQSGYRHIDTAAYYRNEEDVGAAIKQFTDASGVPRESIWVTTKLGFHEGPKDYSGTIRAFEVSLKKLRLEYIDLYLIHCPNDKRNRLDQWRALEDLQKAGKARSIGVSNYGAHHLEELKSASRTVPCINQIELSPYLTRGALVDYCSNHGIAVEAYSPLTKGHKLADEQLVLLAKKYSCTPAQVLIRWSLQSGFVVIPKSTNEERIKENLNVQYFELASSDMSLMSSWDRHMVTGTNSGALGIGIKFQ
ncbi:hypothetical protein CYMTET_34686 [Cymbomonas tetramitiformis]|uniref:NADP-dependent oxidoreductase domain-containing protein n=1 Tax=Cymbomonas tetramitiformis TaxID=36881 RepID=A0AAE0FAQ6_9CHLO|nr:hypothetical protein CYMTET_34686 [Cymbomonas tetramitiformis]